MKLDPTKRDYDNGEFWWVAHPDGLPGSDIEQKLVAHRYDLEIVGGIQDEEASYSYDDWALCKLDGEYYLLSTSGCSCPSPAETWHLEIGPATLQEIENHVRSGKYEGYTVPKRQEGEFIALLRAEAERNCA